MRYHIRWHDQHPVLIVKFVAPINSRQLLVAHLDVDRRLAQQLYSYSHIIYDMSHHQTLPQDVIRMQTRLAPSYSLRKHVATISLIDPQPHPFVCQIGPLTARALGVKWRLLPTLDAALEMIDQYEAVQSQYSVQ